MIARWLALLVCVVSPSIRQVEAFLTVSPTFRGCQTRLQVAFGASNLTQHPDVSFAASAEFTPQCRHTAVFINPNARSVTPKVIETARSVWGHDHVYVTANDEAAQDAIRQAVQQHSYALLVPVGGDGTLARLLELWRQAVVEQAAVVAHNQTQLSPEAALAKFPAVAYLPLGTGNGVGSVVGNPVRPRRRWGIIPRSSRSKRRVLYDTFCRLRDVGQTLADAAKYDKLPLEDFDNDRDWEYLPMPMIQVTSQPVGKVTTSLAENGCDCDRDGDLCFFAGVGFDSLMLNDFKEIKAWSVQTGVLKGFLGSVAGYCVALVVRTLPQSLQGKHRIHVEVTTPTTALWVDHRRGDVVRRMNKSQKTLFKGTTGIVAAGTSPFYGGGLRLFPFARMTEDMMHIRVGRIPPWQGVLQIPQIFAGTYRDTSPQNIGCVDFIGDDFTVIVEADTSTNNKDEGDKAGYPLQHSGEAVGHVTCFRLRVVKEPIRFVCLKEKP
jgi:hypothetical protein